jgi:hypothetical protein
VVYILRGPRAKGLVPWVLLLGGAMVLLEAGPYGKSLGYCTSLQGIAVPWPLLLSALLMR